MRKRKRTYKKRKITGGLPWPFSSNNENFTPVVTGEINIVSGNSPSSSFVNRSLVRSMNDPGNHSKTQQIPTDEENEQIKMKRIINNALREGKEAREKRASVSSRKIREENVERGASFFGQVHENFGGGKTKKNKHKKSRRKRKN
jgi:hypothetical protein